MENKTKTISTYNTRNECRIRQEEKKAIITFPEQKKKKLEMVS